MGNLVWVLDWCLVVACFWLFMVVWGVSWLGFGRFAWWILGVASGISLVLGGLVVCVSLSWVCRDIGFV